MPIDLRSTFLPKRKEVGEAIREILSWSSQRIIVSHGKCIDTDANGVLKWAFRWAIAWDGD
jgi:hypothetical protein